MASTIPYKSQIVVVTGYSGAGKSTVLRALEDSGFYCVDNLPIALLDSFYALICQAGVPGRRVALGIDIRGGHSMDALIAELVKGKATLGVHMTIFFLTSSPQVLLRRFQETRRLHPLAGGTEITQAIRQEKELMRPLIEMADLICDTDNRTIHQLRNFVREAFAHGTTDKMVINLISFGFKYGVPAESNFVYDVRSLPNPYFIPALKALKGTDAAVAHYLFEQPEVIEYWEKLADFVYYSLDKSYQEGRLFMKVAIGCTGGRHRSVAFVNRLAENLASKAQLVVEHRDIDKDVYDVSQEERIKEKVV